MENSNFNQGGQRYDAIKHIDYLINTVKDASSVPFSDKCSIERTETINSLQILRNNLPGAVAQSNDIVARAQDIITTARDKNKKIIDDAGVSEEEKKSAVDAMVKLTENAQMEEDAQMMLEAKGFKNAVVSLSDECCDVIVGKDDVTDEKRAQIEDIIKRKTNIGASNIVISTMD